MTVVLPVAGVVTGGQLVGPVGLKGPGGRGRGGPGRGGRGPGGLWPKIDILIYFDQSWKFDLDSMAWVVLVQDLLQDQEVEEVSRVFGETLEWRKKSVPVDCYHIILCHYQSANKYFIFIIGFK